MARSTVVGLRLSVDVLGELDAEASRVGKTRSAVLLEAIAARLGATPLKTAGPVEVRRGVARMRPAKGPLLSPRGDRTAGRPLPSRADLRTLMGLVGRESLDLLLRAARTESTGRSRRTEIADALPRDSLARATLCGWSDSHPGIEALLRVDEALRAS